MKKGFNMPGNFDATRAENMRSLAAIQASRPLRPPPLRLEEARISAAQREAAKAAARGDLETVSLRRSKPKAA